MKRIYLILGLLALPLVVVAQDIPAPGTETLSVGFTPDLLLSLAMGNQEPQGAKAFPLILAGTFYMGMAKNHEEIILGIGGSPFNLEVLTQYRWYLSEDCKGAFVGLYASLSWMRGNIYFHPDGSVTFPSQIGTQFHSVGLRLGGNIGYRLDFQGLALSPRIGLVIPALVNFGYGDLSKEQVSQLFWINAIVRSVDLAVVIEFLHSVPAPTPK